MRGQEKVLFFSQKMIEKMNEPRNVAKGDWKMLEWAQLMDLLKKEVEELEFECQSGDKLNIASEAADVALFAMFIADKFRSI